jgi:hypothetical protein
VAYLYNGGQSAAAQSDETLATVRGNHRDMRELIV